MTDSAKYAGAGSIVNALYQAQGRRLGNDSCGDLSGLDSLTGFLVKDVQGNWVIGVAVLGKGIVDVHAKVYSEPSEFGIGGGRVSKLWIVRGRGDATAVLCSYERGWDKRPRGAAKALAERIVSALDQPTTNQERSE